MIFKGINYEILQFELEYTDDSELTGFIWQSEITRLGMSLIFMNRYTVLSILVSDVEKVVDWFENLSLNKNVESKILILNDKLYFDLLENNSNSKVILITYDTTTHIPGAGGYSLAPGANKDDSLMKTSIKCVMDDLEIERIAKKLKAELQIELQMGSRIESKKNKKEV